MGGILERMKPAALAVALEGRGLKSSRGRYATPTIYRWADGGIMPPAHVFVESARIANISVDGYLYGGPVQHFDYATSEELNQLRQTVASLQEALAAIQETRGGEIGRERKIS